MREKDNLPKKRRHRTENECDKQVDMIDNMHIPFFFRGVGVRESVREIISRVTTVVLRTITMWRAY